MSGAEAIAALGVISACITLVETSKKLLDAARDQHGLPEAFRVVRDQLPIIARTLQSVKGRSQEAGEDDWKAVKPVLESCDQQLQKLKGILERVMTKETDGHMDRYKKHVKTLGKGHKVEALAQRIFEQLQQLQNNHVFANVATSSELKDAIAKLEKTPPSIDDEDGRYISNGSGPINVARDRAKQTNNNFSGEFKPQGDMNFGAGMA
jgi:CRISPR/Cas system-associated protein Cas10 (large subunit of type III CRISPR-Cas system)